METIYFLIFVGVCAFLVVWATNKSSRKADLAKKRKTGRTTAAQSDKLAHPLDNRLAHKEEIWEQRRKHATKGFTATQNFIPKSSGAEPEYDGYSRRDRHHLTNTGHVKEETHEDRAKEPSMSSVEFESGKHAART